MQEIEKLIDELHKNKRIDKKDLSYMPLAQNIKKLTFWRNQTPVAPRWDGEVWYEDGSHQRITSITPSTKRLLVELISME